MAKGFYTDTTVCIGCKACQVACHEWNELPARHGGATELTGNSYDNTGHLNAVDWRHVRFIEQLPVSREMNGFLDGSRWLMMSDVCKHCVRAGCLEVCPTGAIIRTEFDSVYIQQDVCNGCRACISACPFGVIGKRAGDGRAWKCTMCYDRLHGGLEPACAKACPTDSIQFGELTVLRRNAKKREADLHAQGLKEANLYGADDDVYGGLSAFFLLMDKPEAYNLPNAANAVLPGRNNVGGYLGLFATAVLGLLATIIARRQRNREAAAAPEQEQS